MPATARRVLRTNWTCPLFSFGRSLSGLADPGVGGQGAGCRTRLGALRRGPLARRAIAGIVPDIVTWKKGKDMGNVVGLDRHGLSNVEQFSITDLHPELTKLIDMKKLNGQITSMAESRPKGDDGQTFQFKRNRQAAKNLNQWLRQDYLKAYIG